MRERIKDYDRLLHIREAIANVYEFMEGKNVNDLVNDKLLFYGVVKKGSGSSRAREFHPHPLTEPCVKVSPHTALHTQFFVHRHNLGV